MDTRVLGSTKQTEIFHPSKFETTDLDQPEYDEKRTLQAITEARGQRLTSSKLEDLKSPGAYRFTEDDQKLASSNTRFLFKNLYGETPLTFLFFSEKNVRNIQNLLRLKIHQKTQYVIDDQSVTELMIVMRSIFLEYSRHPKLLTDKMSRGEQRALLAKYTEEVARLNGLVVDAIVPDLVSQLLQYIAYLKDASEQPYHMDKPVNDSVQGQKEYRSITQVLIGGDF